MLALVSFTSIALLRTEVSASSELDCIIEPEMIVKLASPVEGVIARVDVERGDQVRAGQVVAALETELERANVDVARNRAKNESPVRSARARYEFLRRKHGRSLQLRDRSIVSEAALDEVDTEAQVAEHQAVEAQANADLAQLELRRAQVIHDQRSIRSPIDGVIVEKILVPGEYRNVQSHIMTIAQLNPLRVETFVPTRLYGRLQVNQVAEVIPEAPLDVPHRARITVIDRVIDSASGTFGVRLTLSNPELKLPAGLRCRVRFLSETATLN